VLASGDWVAGGGRSLPAGLGGAVLVTGIAVGFVRHDAPLRDS